MILNIAFLLLRNKPESPKKRKEKAGFFLKLFSFATPVFIFVYPRPLPEGIPSVFSSFFSFFRGWGLTFPEDSIIISYNIKK